ncbi:hypothetical protein VTN00DRAFT_5034 [Thermoascus crustaceus]|uniref:uncharacterized protein n=1 Tax=Thermoascus crustaceus TaxID=5088 RepID=UPI0037441B53
MLHAHRLEGGKKDAGLERKRLAGQTTKKRYSLRQPSAEYPLSHRQLLPMIAARKEILNSTMITPANPAPVEEKKMRMGNIMQYTCVHACPNPDVKIG